MFGVVDALIQHAGAMKYRAPLTRAAAVRYTCYQSAAYTTASSHQQQQQQPHDKL